MKVLPFAPKLGPVWAFGYLFAACDAAPPAGSQEAASEPASPVAEENAPVPVLPPDLVAPTAAALPEDATPNAEEAPVEDTAWPGPFFVVTAGSVGIYEEMRAAQELKIGYAREGARLAAHPDPVKRDNCKAGWYQLVPFGYVCGQHGSLELDEAAQQRLPKQPDLDSVLPYRYVRNAHNGTPLYRSVPTKEQIRHYEPYLFEDKSAKTAAAEAKPEPANTAPVAPEIDEVTRKAQEDQARRMAALRAAQRATLGEAAARKLEAEERSEPSIPAAQAPSAAEQDSPANVAEWWQREDTELHQLKLQDLEVTGSDVVATRLIKGFYVAIDRQFDWNRRRWYRSTSGAIAPADRFHAAKGSDFKGVELDETWTLPIGWTYGGSQSKSKYEIDEESKRVKTAGTLKRHEAVNLTEATLQIGKTTYVRATDGFWVRQQDVRITRPGPPPANLRPDETWFDVNLSTQTLVLFRGTQPMYATLISSGREHTIKEKDHRTPRGEFRIRDKQLTSTMSGNGTAAGDLPYRIEAVPYVMFFEGAYALHGAFWHENYGVRMSHGCVNLAPLDAKHLLFQADPPIPPGWHGVWATQKRPGSRVIVHD